MFISLIITTQIIFTAAEIHNGVLFNQTGSNSSHLWHSYTFDTGAGNREELYITNAELDNNFESISGVFMWKSLYSQEQVVIIGLSVDFILVTTLNGENDSLTFKEEVSAPGKTLAVFQKWDTSAQRVKSYVIVVTQSSEEYCILTWYQIENNELKFLWVWQYHGSISYLSVIKISHELKLLIVNPKKPAAEIYSFDVGFDLDIWLFEKITFNAGPSSVAIFDNNENTFLSASFPALDLVHVFKYSKALCSEILETKHFMSHQKIYISGIKSLISFQVGFIWYLAIASNHSVIYQLGSNLEFQPIHGSHASLGDFNNWMAVPIDTYRDDTILLADSSSDIFVMTWATDGIPKVVGSLAKLGCRDDMPCLEKTKRVVVNGSTAFGCDQLQNVILTTDKGSPLLFKLFFKLKPLPDKIMFKLKQTLHVKDSLKKIYMNQRERIAQLIKSKDLSSDSTIFLKPKKVLEAVSHKRNETLVVKDAEQLKATVNSLSHDIKKLLNYLKLNFSNAHAKNFSNNNIPDGITFHGNVSVRKMDLVTINGHPVNELLEDSFRKDRARKINGKKMIKSLDVENVILEKTGDIFSCDIMFSDDAWENENYAITGDLTWDNKLIVMKNVVEHNATMGKKLRGMHGPIYDSLNLEDLEVTEDFHIQKTINRQPFILPIHGNQVNVLNTVHQARIEVVNVKEKLDVELINGKNLSLLNGIHSPPLKSLKIDGVFSAPLILANRFNGVELSEKQKETDSSEEETNNSLKRASKFSLKRIVHVFNNIEVDGTLFTNKMNNVTWEILNDTVKKNEHNINFVGSKKFKEGLSAKKTILSGTINGRFVDNIMTNSSNQNLRSEEFFDSVEFKNLNLKGVWDGIVIEKLIKSVVKFSSDNRPETSLTFENECFANVLNVTDTFNNMSVGTKDENVVESSEIELKTIKASNVVLHGSLITSNNINNQNLSEFNLLRVSLKFPETVEQDISHDEVTVLGDLNLETVNFNDVSSVMSSGGDTKLIEKLMNGETDQIKKMLVKGNMSTLHGVNGFILSEVFEKGFYITKGGSIKGNVTFENIIYFDRVNATDALDGFSLKELEKDIAMKHSHVFLTGPKNFSVVEVTKNARARSLNGHLVQETASVKGDHKMKGAVRVNGNVIVRGNVTSYSSVNDISVPDLMRTYSTGLGSFLYSGDLEMTSENVTVGNLVVGGKIQNVPLDTFLEEVVREEEGAKETFDIFGRKLFKGQVIFNENVSIDLIHGLNFTKFYSNIAFINKPTKISGTVTIKECVFKDLKVSANFNSNLINNFDTNEWLEESISLNGEGIVGGKKIFKDAHALENVSVDFINGHLSSEMIPLRNKQFVPSLALCTRIRAESDLSVGGLVNGKNLMRELEDTVLLSGHQVMGGETYFNLELVLNGSLVVETIKGYSVKDFVTLDTDQTITTPLEFKGSVRAKRNVENLKIINNISLNDWSKRAVLLNQEQVLNGLWTVRGKVKTKNIEGEGLIHSVNLANISKNIRKWRVLAMEMKNATEAEFFAECRQIKEVSTRFAKLPLVFDHFELIHEMETSTTIDSVIRLQINGRAHFIVTFSNECFSTLYEWNRGEATLKFKREINIGSVNKWLVIHRTDATYLITSSFPNELICEDNLNRGNVWVFGGDSDKYTHLLTMNGFVDIVQENASSSEFFTIDENGNVQQWSVTKDGSIGSKLLLSLGSGNYRFIDFRILEGLTILNGREIIFFDGDELIRQDLPFSNAQVVALPIEGKTLAAVVLRDKIVVYDDLLKDKIFFVIHTYKPASVLWMNIGPGRQSFLVVASHHKVIEVFEFKGVAGLVKAMSIHMSSLRLQLETLPSETKCQHDKYLTVIQKKKLSLIRADAFGDFFKETETQCGRLP